MCLLAVLLLAYLLFGQKNAVQNLENQSLFAVWSALSREIIPVSREIIHVSREIVSVAREIFLISREVIFCLARNHSSSHEIKPLLRSFARA